MKTQFSSKVLYLILMNVFIFLSVVNDGCFAQSNCFNADFEQNSFAGWSGTTGSCCPINSTLPGLVAGRHTIMSGPGTDPFTNGQLTVVAPGGLHSARLGNSNVGSQAEQLKYSFPVTVNSELFIYRYAVVLEDPGHLPNEQPRFEIKVYDQSGAPIACGSYFVYSSAGISGFQTTLVNGSTIHWKDWTSVGVDLSGYVGQTVTIEFSTGDCDLGAHFGYAYVDCYCSPLTITTDYCPGSINTVLVAPPGFNSYIWSTGDTTQSITVNNPAIGTTYTVSLVSVSGCAITLSQVITVTSLQPSFTFQNQCSKTVQFNNTSNLLSNVIWNFGDGNTSTEVSPSHQFPSPGSYNVSLTIGIQNACDSTIIRTINILPDPVSAFVFPLQCAGKPIQFTDQSFSANASILSWSWNFGDGSPHSVVQNPSHTFGGQTNYNVTLMVADSNGCRDTLTKMVGFIPNPIALISTNAKCANELVTFRDSSTITAGTINSWQWEFGDNTPVSSLQNPVHRYASSGTYTINLIVTSDRGCTDTANAKIKLMQGPSAGFSFQPNEITVFNPSVFFIDESLQGTQWTYLFGDGDESTLQNPIHTYTNAQSTYEIWQYVRSADGCIDSISKTIEVKKVQSLYVPNSFTPNDDLLNNGFRAYGIGITNFEMIIYDRWGLEIFRSLSIDQIWDGNVNGSQAQADVYVYKIIASDVDKQKYNLIGTVTLVR